MSGRLTLNPLKHLDPIGTLCLLFFHMGWANPVPINPYYYKDRKKGIILVSLAGPAVNLLLAFVSLLIEGLLMLYGSSSSSIVQTAMSLAYYSAVLNIGLGIFNLIPVPPLDGSHVLGGAVSKGCRTLRTLCPLLGTRSDSSPGIRCLEPPPWFLK